MQPITGTKINNWWLIFFFSIKTAIGCVFHQWVLARLSIYIAYFISWRQPWSWKSCTSWRKFYHSANDINSMFPDRYKIHFGNPVLNKYSSVSEVASFLSYIKYVQPCARLRHTCHFQHAWLTTPHKKMNLTSEAEISISMLYQWRGDQPFKANANVLRWKTDPEYT